MLLDTTGVSLRLSAALRGLLGEWAWLGLHWRALLEPIGDDPGPIQACLEDGAVHIGEQSFRRLPGIWQVSASRYQNAAGDPAGVVTALHDVTESRRQQEQAFEAARLAEIGQLAGGIAHEINTPLASIALRAETLLQRCGDPALLEVPAFERFPRYLETIDRETFRCKRIIASLLEFARSGRPEVQLTDLNALLGAAVDLISHAARNKGIALETAFHAALPRVLADATQMRQVALALLTNAVDATGDGGRIRIATGTTAEGEVFLEVSDDGCGIAEAEREQVFAPFHTSKGGMRGTGLGLAVCRQVAAAHGGRIDLEPAPEGGSRFRVSLPTRGAGE